MILIGSDEFARELVAQKYNRTFLEDMKVVSLVVTNDTVNAFNTMMYNTANFKANYLFYGDAIISLKQKFDNASDVGSELLFQQYKDDKLNTNNFEIVYAMALLNVNGSFNGTPEFFQRWQNENVKGLFFNNIVAITPNAPNDKFSIQLNGYLLKV